MKKIRLDVIVFLLLLTALGTANILSGSKPAFSELENRMLKKKPEFTLQALTSGSYLKDYEEYYNDTFILRDWLVKGSRNIRDLMSFTKPDISLVMTSEPNEASASNIDDELDKPEPVNTPVPSMNQTTPQPTSTPVKKEFDENRNVGYWVVKDGKAVQLFKFNKANMEYYAAVLNKYRQKLGQDIKLYSFIPPSNSEFVMLKQYKGMTDSQNDAMDFLNSRLDAGVQAVNVYDALNKHKDEYIYFRSDHHWTALGAYYGYSAFMESSGQTPVPVSQYKTTRVEGFLGSAYSKTLNKNLEKNPDYLDLYLPLTENTYTLYEGSKSREAPVIDMKYAQGGKDKYLVFLSSGGATWSVIKTGVKNGKKILLIKDSFGNALAPFLISHYEEIYIVDPRFYQGKNMVDFTSENGINEVLVETYMENVNWKEFMGKVEKLIESK